jgi:hypothetical protein
MKLRLFAKAACSARATPTASTTSAASATTAGNILSLSRTDNGTRLDSLAYTYSGNRLLKVNDRVSTASPNHFPANTANHGLISHYTYDANGNLTADVNKGHRGSSIPGTPFSSPADRYRRD